MLSLANRTSLTLAACLGMAATGAAKAQTPTQPTYESLWAQVHAENCVAKDETNSYRFDCQADHKTYFFSRPGTPMHPGVVIRAIVRDASGISIHSSGYSFDDMTRIAFQAWLDQFQKQDEQLEDAINKKKPATKPS